MKFVTDLYSLWFSLDYFSSYVVEFIGLLEGLSLVQLVGGIFSTILSLDIVLPLNLTQFSI